MPRVCTVCTHDEREQIDRALLSAQPYRVIAHHFAASPDAVLRHKAHLAFALVQAQQAVEVARADSLLDQVRHLQSKALMILAAAESAGDLRTALAAVGQARATLELLARLQGELADGTTVNVTMQSEWPALRWRIVSALEPFPEARQAVLVSLNGHANH